MVTTKVTIAGVAIHYFSTKRQMEAGLRLYSDCTVQRTHAGYRISQDGRIVCYFELGKPQEESLNFIKK